MSAHALFSRQRLHKLFSFEVRRFLTREAIIFILYAAISSMVLNVFMQTRSLEEGSKAFGFAAMLAGTAERPYVYRQLIPMIANHATELIPEKDRDAFVQYHLDKFRLKQQYFGEAKFPNKANEQWTPSYAIKYHIA